jgi:hypothetical protein
MLTVRLAGPPRTSEMTTRFFPVPYPISFLYLELYLVTDSYSTIVLLCSASVLLPKAEPLLYPYEEVPTKVP